MAMAVDFVVGKAFEALYKGVEEVIRNNVIFSDLFKDIKGSLDVLSPLIKEMGEYNQQLHLTKELEALEGLLKNRGMKLVGKCSTLRKWKVENLYKKPKYTKELQEFKESLQKELEVLKVQMARDVKKTEVAVENMARDVKNTRVAAENMARDVKKTEVVVENMARDLKNSEVSAENMARDVKKTGVAVENMAIDVKKTEAAAENIARDVKKTGLAVENMAKDVKKTEVAAENMARGVKKTEAAVEDIARDVKKTEAAAENIEVVVQNIQKGVSMLLKKNGEELEIEDSSVVLPELPELIVGLEVPLEKLNVQLLKDEVSMLIVTAPAGCGKTTLATMLCQDQDVKDKFQENIFFVRFTKKPNLERIMKGLYEQKGYKGPASQNEATPVKWLEKVEMEKGDDPLLLVLDDVWSESEFLLEKFQFKMSNYKILVTSRSEFPKFGPSYHLKLLDYEDAMELFRHTASLGDKSSHIPEHLSKEIVKHCYGFPLTITLAGRSLCGQPEEMWQSRVDEWSEGSSILDFETDPLLQLQSRLDVLDNAPPIIKTCFFDLGAFTGDEIPVTDLFNIWAALYYLKKETSCIVKLYELKTRGLLHLQEPEGDKGVEVIQEAIDYSQYVIRQDDLLRKLAIYNLKRDPVQQRERLIIEIRGDNFPKWWREQKYPYINARLVSISTDVEFSVKWPNMELPEAEVLVLNFQPETSYALPEFVERMHKLKTLVVVNRSVCRFAELDNFELLGSLSNLWSLRLDGIDISCITKSSVQLKNLHKLYLRGGSYDDEGPVDFSYVFPNVKEMVIIEALEFWVFHELVHLTKLIIIASPRHSFKLPEAIGNLVSLQVLRLEALDLCKVLPDSIGELKKLKLLIIKRCCWLNALPESIGNLVSLEVLRLEDCSPVIPDSIGNLKRLKFLKIFNNKSSQVLPQHIGKLKCLRHLIIDHCDQLYELPESIGNLVNLEVLSLRYSYILSNLPKSIINLQKLNFLDIDACCKIGELPVHFGELKSLRKLRMVFCSLLRKLPPSVSQLEQLEVICEDWHAKHLWTPLSHTIKNLSIVVWKPE